MLDDYFLDDEMMEQNFGLVRPPEQRKPVEEMTTSDWVTKIQKLRARHEKLEVENDKLKQKIEKSRQDRVIIKEKVQDVTGLLAATYQRNEELEKVIQQQKQEIKALHERINSITRLENEGKQTGGSSVVRHIEVDNSESEQTEQLLTESLQREEQIVQENASLRARIIELEGLLTGTLYHNAYRGTPLKLSSDDTKTPMKTTIKSDATTPTNQNSATKSKDAYRKQVFDMIEALNAVTKSVPPTPQHFNSTAESPTKLIHHLSDYFTGDQESP